jgi:peptidyl-dipeptidase Dcp
MPGRWHHRVPLLPGTARAATALPPGAAAGGPAFRTFMNPSNPLLEAWDTPQGLPPYDRVRPEHFAPAIAEAMRRHRQELARIGAQQEAPTLANTLEAFDRSGTLMDRVVGTFYTLTSSHTNDALQALQLELAGPLADHESAVCMDAALFGRIDALHGQREQLALSGPQRRLLERVHLDFVRAGARLAGPQQRRYAELMSELARLTTQFAQNVLSDETRFVLHLEHEADLDGLPGFVRDAARQAAAERGWPEGHVITLSRSLVVPFLTYSKRRDLREAAWRAWTSRGEHEGDSDNRALARRILELRQEQARLQGHACFADFALADTMAGTRGAVQQLFDEVWPRALQALRMEREAIVGAMRAAGVEHALEAWDWRYWAERVRVARYAVDDAEVKPYFRLESVVAAAFDCAQRLFGLVFRERPDLPAYHPDVRRYEVHDASGRLVGVFLQDNFARASKRSGAWMSSLRHQHRNGPAGGAERPVVLNNNNFAKGSPDEPTLLSLDDARTLFHEFGHGLHGLLSDVDYLRLSGTQVLRDFVELPSQIFEHWLMVPEQLERHARHWKTGQPVPADLVRRLRAAERFNQGFETVRYAGSALVDMAVHSIGDGPLPEDLCAFERELLAGLGHPPEAGINHRLVHFQHLFAGSSYAAGYYVYLWADVLVADGFDAFEEAGNAFDPELAGRLQRYIYSSGNSLDPMSAYRSFRGRAATVGPLLKQRGLLDEPA